MHKFQGQSATVYSLYSGTLEEALAAVRHAHAHRHEVAVLWFNDVLLPVTLDYTDEELSARYRAQCNWRYRRDDPETDR